MLNLKKNFKRFLKTISDRLLSKSSKVFDIRWLGWYSFGISDQFIQSTVLGQLIDWVYSGKKFLFLFFWRKYKIDNLQVGKVNRKQISKLALRLLKTYQLPVECCPNLSKDRNLKNLRYLMFKKYTEQTLTGTAWDELIMVCFDC